MSAPRYAFPNLLNTALGTIDTDVVSIEKRFAALKMPFCPPKHLSPRRYRILFRKRRVHTLCDCIRFQQIQLTLEFAPPDDAALSGTVRPRKNSQDGQRSVRYPIKHTNDVIVPVPGSAGTKANLVLPAIRLLHNVKVESLIPIENRNTRLQGFDARPGTCRDHPGNELLPKVRLFHVPIVAEPSPMEMVGTVFLVLARSDWHSLS